MPNSTGFSKWVIFSGKKEHIGCEIFTCAIYVCVSTLTLAFFLFDRNRGCRNLVFFFYIFAHFDPSKKNKTRLSYESILCTNYFRGINSFSRKKERVIFRWRSRQEVVSFKIRIVTVLNERFKNEIAQLWAVFRLSLILFYNSILLIYKITYFKIYFAFFSYLKKMFLYRNSFEIIWIIYPHIILLVEFRKTIFLFANEN